MRQSGLTTIELVVTLAVAALLLLSGFTFYEAISRRAGASRMMSEASNIAQEVLRRDGTYQAVSTLCSSTSTHPNQTISRSAPTITNLNIVLYRCKVSNTSPLIRVTVVVSYGNPTKEVAHAIYVAST